MFRNSLLYEHNFKKKEDELIFPDFDKKFRHQIYRPEETDEKNSEIDPELEDEIETAMNHVDRQREEYGILIDPFGNS
jgi:hypothetical protein